MLSNTEIVNSALTLIGERPIMSIEDDTVVARAVSSVLPVAIRDFLSDETNWNCAIETFKLNKLVNTDPTGRFANVYQLPNSPERIRILDILIPGYQYQISDRAYSRELEDKSMKYYIQGNFLYSDLDEVTISYIKYIEPSEFSSYMLDAFSKKLAYELTFFLTSSTSSAAALRELADNRLRKARSKNALEKNSYLYNFDIVRSR